MSFIEAFIYLITKSYKKTQRNNADMCVFIFASLSTRVSMSAPQYGQVTRCVVGP